MASTTSKSLKINQTDVANATAMRKRKFVTNASDTKRKEYVEENGNSTHTSHPHTFFVHSCFSFSILCTFDSSASIDYYDCVCCARLNPSEYLRNALQSESPISSSGVFILFFFTSLSIWLLSYLQFAQMLHPSDGVLRYTSSPNIFSPTRTRTRASARALLSRSLGQW